MLVNIHLFQTTIYGNPSLQSTMLQFISLPLKIELISDTNAQLIQNSITSYHKNQERTRNKTRKEKKESNRSHD